MLWPIGQEGKLRIKKGNGTVLYGLITKIKEERIIHFSSNSRVTKEIFSFSVPAVNKT